MKYLTFPIFLLILSISGVAQDAPTDAPARLLSAPAFEISAEDEAAGIDGTMKVAMIVTNRAM